MMAPLRLYLPGVALCVGITAAAKLIEKAEVQAFGHLYLEGLEIAILIGVAIRGVWAPGPLWAKGIGFSAKQLLEIAVVLLGASISGALVWALGPILLIGIATVVAIALASSYALCRALGLPKKMSVLIACGNSICGNSAIAAVAPVIGARAEDIASSIAFTAVLGVVVVLTLPLLVPVLDLSLTQYGTLAGLTVYAVPQVLAATLPIGALANQVGTIVKLVRVLMLGPVVVGRSPLAGRMPAAGGRNRRRRAPAVQGAGAVVHHRFPAARTLALAWVHSAEPGRAAAHRGVDPDDDLDGGAGARRRCAQGRTGRAARHRGGHRLADRARPD